MAWLGDKEFWVALIGYASIASVALFGLFGAYAKIREKPRTAGKTRPTRRLELFSVLGIIFSAVLAMSSAILRSWIDDEKSTQQAASTALDDAEQRSRFFQQLATLYRLNVRMIHANADSRETLRKQDRLLRSAQRSMLLTARLGVAQQASTARIRRDLWDEATRINGSNIQISVEIRCPTSNTTVQVLPDAAQARMRVVPAQSAGRYPDSQFNLLAGDLMLGQEGVTLRTTSHVTGLREEGPEDDRTSIQFSTFGPFAADRLAPFDRLEAWNGALVEVMIFGTYSNARNNFHEATENHILDPRDGERNSRYGAQRFPCQTSMHLLLNQRFVGAFRADLILVSSQERDVVDSLRVKSRILRLNPDLFPLFDRPR